MGGAVAAIVVGALIYWFGPQHLFLDTRVDEALPTATTDGGRESTPGDTGGLIGGATDGAAADAGGNVVTTLASGPFQSLEHETSGVASIVEVGDGTRYLRIEDLDTSSGPDLRVYLSQAPADGSEDALDDAFVDLGGLKGNQGNQNYEIPADVDLKDFASVSIWCRRFSAGFGVAPLQPA
jgi:hypothetical protein